MRVLVAGDRGYIGAVLVQFLRAAGPGSPKMLVDNLDASPVAGLDASPARV